MKKAAVLLLVLCLGIAGCGKESALVPRTHGDLTIGIPGDYLDLSEESFAEGLDFIYGLDPIAVNGLREPKETFTAYGLELDLERYGDLLLKSNQVDAGLSRQEELLYFTYTANGYTYLVTLWETDTAFWTVQAYCPADHFRRAEDTMWRILRSVTI